jgi:hypothetical protein
MTKEERDERFKQIPAALQSEYMRNVVVNHYIQAFANGDFPTLTDCLVACICELNRANRSLMDALVHRSLCEPYTFHYSNAGYVPYAPSDDKLKEMLRSGK